MLCACFKFILCFIGLQKCRGFEKKIPRGDTRKKDNGKELPALMNEKSVWRNEENLKEENDDSNKKAKYSNRSKPTFKHVHQSKPSASRKLMSWNWRKLRHLLEFNLAKISFQIAPSEISVHVTLGNRHSSHPSRNRRPGLSSRKVHPSRSPRNLRPNCPKKLSFQKLSPKSLHNKMLKSPRKTQSCKNMKNLHPLK